MEKMRKLPDAEFDIMTAVWELESPVAANAVLKHLGKTWKIQALISLMLRLVDKGFLRTEKIGRDRVYYPLVAQEDYLKFETNSFIKQYHNNSLIRLVNTLYDDEALTDEDIDKLIEWTKERRK